MRNLPLLLAVIVIMLGFSANAQNTYKEHFTVDSAISEDDAYLMVQDWFVQNPCTFTSQNNDAKGLTCSNRNKQNADVAFTNVQPLQSVDPYGKKFSARCLAKYADNGTSGISVLYVEYYLMIEIKGKHITASISPMKYHHFNKNSFAPQQVYSWQGGAPSSAAGNVDDLVSNLGEGNTADLQKYLKQDTTRLITALKTHLKEQQAIASR